MAMGHPSPAADMPLYKFQAMSRSLCGNIKQQFSGVSRQMALGLRTVQLGGCHLTQICAPSHRVDVMRSLRKSYDADSVKVLVQLSGRSLMVPRSHEIEISAASVLIYDPARDYTLINETYVHQLIFQAPRVLFSDAILARLEHPISLTADEGVPSSALAFYIRKAVQEADTAGSELRQALGHSLATLTQGIVAETSRVELEEQLPCTSLDLLRARIVEYVTQNITDANLDAGHIAQQMGCSKSYVFRAFHDREDSLQKQILNIRLDFARQLLISPNLSKNSISDITFRSGFNSSAHFSRVFKHRFGMSPRQMRNSAN